MRKSILSVLTISIVCIFTSCQKDADGPSGGSSGPVAILTSGKWQLTSSVSEITIPGFGVQTQDLFAITDACVIDNYSIFNSDGTGTSDEGATKCDPSAPQTTTNSRWELLNNNKQLKVSANGSVMGITEMTADILTLNDNELTFRYTTDVGIHAVTTESMKHIK